MTQLTVIKQEDLHSAGQVLATTKTWIVAYEKKRDNLLALAKKDGEKLTPETDTLINDYLASLKKAAASAEDNRKPFTSKLNEVVKLFTTEESKLKGELAIELQNIRNSSVAAYKKQEIIDAGVAQKKLDIAKAKIELFSEAESQIRNQYAALLRDDKAKLMEIYENCTLEMYDAILEMLNMVVGSFTEEIWSGVNAVIGNPLVHPQMKYLTPEEIDLICIDAKVGKFEKVAPHYQTEIKAYADHLVTLMSERKLELEAGVTENTTATKLKEEQAVVEAKQAGLAAERSEQVVQAQMSSVIIDSQISSANRSVSMPKAQSIDSYEIIFLDNNLGWSEIFKFYSTHCGSDLEGKTKLESMKVFAERVAKSQGLRIESPYIKYEEKFKAVTKSKKAA